MYEIEQTTQAEDTATQTANTATQNNEDHLQEQSSNDFNVQEQKQQQGNEAGQTKDLNLDNVDLSFLGINQVAQTQDENTQGNAKDETQGKDEINEIKEMISGLSDNKHQEQIPLEEAQAITELFDKFKQLGLINDNGLSKEDKELLKDTKEINKSFKQQEEEQKAYFEHQTKLEALKDFDKQLSQIVPGYDSKFMQKVIGDIHKTNPEAGMRILNNPSLLINLWNEIGAKAQPSNKNQNVINTTGQSNNSLAQLEQKVNDGTATEYEEAQFISQL